MNKEERLMMSEEEVRQRAKELLNLPKEDLITQHLFLQQENKSLKEVIDKAIENIENFLCTEDYINVNGIAIAENYKELLEILKGEDNV